jgi:hypothetical protein
MLTRFFVVLVTTLVAAGSLAVASALATDEPAPKPGDSQSCIDNMRPISHLGTHRRRSLRVAGDDFPLDDSDLSGPPRGRPFDQEATSLRLRYPRLVARFR